MNRITIILKDDYEGASTLESDNIFEVKLNENSISFSVENEGIITEHWINKNEIIRYEFTEFEEE